MSSLQRKHEGVVHDQWIPIHLRNRRQTPQQQSPPHVQESMQEKFALPENKKSQAYVVPATKKSGYIPIHLRDRSRRSQQEAHMYISVGVDASQSLNRKEGSAASKPAAQPPHGVAHHEQSAAARQPLPVFPQVNITKDLRIDSAGHHTPTEEDMQSFSTSELCTKIQELAKDISVSRGSGSSQHSLKITVPAKESNGIGSSRWARPQSELQRANGSTHSQRASTPGQHTGDTCCDAPASAFISQAPGDESCNSRAVNGIDIHVNDSTLPRARKQSSNTQITPRNANRVVKSALKSLNKWADTANGATKHTISVPTLPAATAGRVDPHVTPNPICWWGSSSATAQEQAPTDLKQSRSDGKTRRHGIDTILEEDDNESWTDPAVPVSRQEAEASQRASSQRRGNGRGRGCRRGRGRGRCDGGGGRAAADNIGNPPVRRRTGGWFTKEEKVALKAQEKRVKAEWADGWNWTPVNRDTFTKEANLDLINTFDNDGEYVDVSWALQGFLGHIAEDLAREKEEQRDPWAAIRHLCDWDGGWGPPPEDWQERNRHRKENMYAVVYRWVERSEACQGTILEGNPRDMKDLRKRIKKDAIDITHRRYLGHLDQTGNVKSNSDIVPRYWTPDHIDDMPIDEWWEVRATRAPGPDDEEDLDPELKPFWETWGPGDNTPYQRNYQHPVECPMDPADIRYDLYQSHPTSNKWAKHRREKIRRDKQETRDARRAAYRTPEQIAESIRIVEEDWARQQAEWAAAAQPVGDGEKQVEEVKEEIEKLETKAETNKPAINMYVRPAAIADLPQIMEIWNFYQLNTVYVPEANPFTLGGVLTRFQDITNELCPFFDGVERGGNRKGVRGSSHVRHKNYEEKILGFAFADRTHTIDGMYRATAELEVFVREDYTKSGIATNLLEQVISASDIHYTKKLNCETRIPDQAFRQFINMLILLPSETARECDRDVWVGKWLHVAFGFKYTGRFEMMGARNGKWVDQSHFQRRTTGYLDPAQYSG